MCLRLARCVDEKDKPVAMGLGITLMSLFAFMPSPIFFGYLMGTYKMQYIYYIYRYTKYRARRLIRDNQLGRLSLCLGQRGARGGRREAPRSLP